MKRILTLFVVLASTQLLAQLAPSQATGQESGQVVQGKVVTRGKVVFTGGAQASIISIAITPTSDFIQVGTTDQYQAIATYNDINNTQVDITKSCAWVSSNLSIATISNTGLATGVSSSNTPVNISCSSNGVQSNIAQLTVTQITITTTTCPNGNVGAVYTCNLAETGGTGPFTWSVDTLPAGLSITAGTGVISGTPTTKGTTNFVATVVDSLGSQDTQALSITIGVPSGLSLANVTLPQGSVNQAYASTLIPVSGGTPPYSCPDPNCVSVGSLPAGITGAIQNGASPGILLTGSNITAAVATYNFTGHVTDSAAGSTTQTYSITIINGAPLTYTSPACHQSSSGTLSCPATGTCDCSAWPIASISAAPNFGGLASGTGFNANPAISARCHNDPRSGNLVMRITDSTTSMGTLTIANANAGDVHALNADNTMIALNNTGGQAFIIPINTGACTVQAPIKIAAAQNGSIHFDMDNPNIFYAILSKNSRTTVVSQCTVNTGRTGYSCVPLVDFADNPGTTPHGSGGLLPGYQVYYTAAGGKYSTYDNNGAYNPQRVFGALVGGGPPWSQNGPYFSINGTHWQVNQVVRPNTTNNNLKNSFRIISCVGTCTGASVEPTWDTTCPIGPTTANGWLGQTCTDGTITWRNIGPHNIQDGPFDLIFWDSQQNCFTHLDINIGYVMNSNCPGQSTGALSYINGAQNMDSQHKFGGHGGGITPNSSWSTFACVGCWKNDWQLGSMVVDVCQSTGTGYCQGHSTEGVLGYYGGKPEKLHPYPHLNNCTGFSCPPLFIPPSGYKEGYNNGNGNDTTPVCIYTTRAGDNNLAYTVPFWNEIDCYPVDGSNTIWRMGQAYNSGIHKSYNIQDSGIQTNKSGQYVVISTDNLGNFGSETGSNSCVSGTPGCVTSQTSGDTCYQGGQGYSLNKAYTANTLVNPGIVVSTSGYAQASGNPGPYGFVAHNSGTSGSTNIWTGTTFATTWAQAPVVSITSATQSGTLVTLTTSTAHAYSISNGTQYIRVSGVGVAGYNGLFQLVGTPTSTTLTYNAYSSGLGASSGGKVNSVTLDNVTLNTGTGALVGSGIAWYNNALITCRGDVELMKIN